MIDDEIDYYANQALITGGGLSSSRHNGTHELVAKLIAKQENKFATITSQNNLVVFENCSSKYDS